MTTGTPELITVEELLRRPANKLEELIEGKLFYREPKRSGPAFAGRRLMNTLVLFERDHPEVCGVYAFGLGYVVGRDPDSVLAPSIGIVDPEHAAEIERGEDGFSVRTPMIAVENQEYSNDPALIARKVAIYLRAGSREVCWIRSMASTVTVHRPDTAPHVLTDADTLTSDLLPGFRLDLHEMFREKRA